MVFFEFFSSFQSLMFLFRASLPPGEIGFNQELEICLMWVNSKLILHVVDTHTMYKNAVFIISNTAENFWYHFELCRESLYSGYPNLMRLGKERSVWTISFGRCLFSKVHSYILVGLRCTMKSEVAKLIIIPYYE